MSVVRDIIGDVKRRRGVRKELRLEDTYRRLAVNERRGYRLPIIYGNNDFVLTPTAAWTGFAVGNKPWGFLSKKVARDYFRNGTSLYSRVFPSTAESEGHLLVTNRVYTADEWESALLENYADTATDNFARFVRASREVIEQREFFDRECYVFSRLGARGNPGGLRGFVQSVVDFWEFGAGLDDSKPDPDEIKFWGQQANSMVDTLSTSWLRAQPIHRRRSEWLMRHLDSPGLATPDVAPADAQEWGPGEWRTVLSNYTREVDLGEVGKKKYRAVEFDGPTGTSYAAYLPINHIPSDLHYLQNFLHHPASLPFPVDASVHFEVVDPDRASEAMAKSIEDAEVQRVEDREAGVETDDMTELQQQGLRRVKTKVQQGRRPVVYWQAVLCVYDTDKEELLSKVSKLIKHYHDIDFELVCPRNDQRELFYQTFPGSEIRVEDWIHRSDPEYFAAGQPWLTSSVGDRDDALGLYQGHTLVRDAQGFPQKGVPVFYDLQNVVDDEGKAPTEAVVGEPGSGKTVSRGLKTALEDALRGVTQFVWDPKGDFLPLYTWAREMQLDPEKVKLVDLRNSNDSVSLDAIAVAEVDPKRGIDDRETSAVDTLFALSPHFVEDANHGVDYQSILRSAVKHVLAREAAGGEKARMVGVLDCISRWRDKDFSEFDPGEDRQKEWPKYCHNLDDHLRSQSQDTLGRLLFSDPDEVGTITVEPGDLVLFVAPGMNTTQPGQKQTPKTIIPDTISAMMTDFIRSLLLTLDDTVVKCAVFDEWHVIKRSGRAEALLDWMKRMGRSKRCMVRQLSQHATDVEKSSLSTIWAGYAETDTAAEATCVLLGIEASEANISQIQNLKAGQFFFRDVYGRIALVQVDIWDDWLLEKFNTQAKAKAEMAKRLAQEEAASQVAATVG